MLLPKGQYISVISSRRQREIHHVALRCTSPRFMRMAGPRVLPFSVCVKLKDTGVLVKCSLFKRRRRERQPRGRGLHAIKPVSMLVGASGCTYFFFEEGILKVWTGGLVVHPLGWG